MCESLLNWIPRLAENASNPLIGWRKGKPVTRVEFINRVHRWRTLLASSSGQQFALYLEDSLEFAAALFGGWHAGKTIWLASDNLNSSNDALKRSVDGF